MHLKRGDLLLSLILESNACIGTNIENNISDSKLSSNPISADSANNKISENLFKVVSSQTRLYEKSAMLGLVIAWFIADNRIDLAEELWKSTCSEMIAFIENKIDIQPYDRRHEALQLVCSSVNNMDVPILERIAVGNFMKKIIIDYHEYISYMTNGDGTTTDSSPINSRNNDIYNMSLPLKITEELGEELINLFGVIRDNQAASATFVVCESQNTVLSSSSFSILSRLLLRDGEYNLVFQLLEMYLNALDRTEHSLDPKNAAENQPTATKQIKNNPRTTKSMPSILLSYTKFKKFIDSKRQKDKNEINHSNSTNTVNNNMNNNMDDLSALEGSSHNDLTTTSTSTTSQRRLVSHNVFTPSLIALIELQQIDMILKLLKDEIPKYCKYPTSAHVIYAMIGLNKVGRFEEAIQLFFEFFYPYQTNTTITNNNNNNNNSNNSYNNNHMNKILPIDGGSFHVVLTCCANGKYGNEALKILSLIEKYSKNNINQRLSAGDELRLIGLTVKSLSTSSSIQYLPELLAIIMKHGAQSKPRILTHQLYAICLAATVYVKSIPTAKLVMDIFAKQGKYCRY